MKLSRIREVPGILFGSIPWGTTPPPLLTTDETAALNSPPAIVVTAGEVGLERAGIGSEEWRGTARRLEVYLVLSAADDEEAYLPPIVRALTSGHARPRGVIISDPDTIERLEGEGLVVWRITCQASIHFDTL